MKRLAPALAALAFALLWAASADACPACAGNGMPLRTVNAYIAMTLLLATLPMAVGGGLWWMLRPARDVEPPLRADEPSQRGG